MSMRNLGIGRKAPHASAVPFILRAHESSQFIGARRDALTGERVNLIGRSDRPAVPGTVEVFPGVRVLTVDTGPRDCGE